MKNKKKLDFIPRPEFVQDLNYLSKLDAAIIPEVKDAISILRENSELPSELSLIHI